MECEAVLAEIIKRAMHLSSLPRQKGKMFDRIPSCERENMEELMVIGQVRYLRNQVQENLSHIV